MFSKSVPGSGGRIVGGSGRDWLGSETYLRLPPQVQLLFALLLLIGAVVATDWGNLVMTAVIQWASALFVLPVFAPGLRWLWTRLRQHAGQTIRCWPIIG